MPYEIRPSARKGRASSGPGPVSVAASAQKAIAV